MTQRIRDRLFGEFNLDNEILVEAYRKGEYTDQFTTKEYTPEETKAILNRLPKCMQNRGQR